ncbi:M28 family peptidase [Stieleria sp. JC731]|uniref:M28 family peptidase n=1 Tax=Pirellulaceae TaxID=2691357 RepID=UPI001E5E02E6|nr:M28 family peptidase [Stieleria sp. JC731]MCC9602556.1 M28 family peptidase [Stieleria sp. JC731]
MMRRCVSAGLLALASIVVAPAAFAVEVGTDSDSGVDVAPGSVQEDPVRSVQEDSVRLIQEDIQYLASEELRGRSVTDETIDQARDYIKGRMQSIGLEMNLVGGDGLQPVEISVGSEVRSVEKNYAEFNFGAGDTILKKAVLGNGFSPLSVGIDSAEVSGRLVFAGYGISSEEHQYDDFAGVDVKDAFVVILRKEPGADDPESRFDGVQNTRHAYFAVKIQNAIRHGAAGVLIVNDPASIRDAVGKEQDRITLEEMRLVELRELLNDLPPEAVRNIAATKDKIARAESLIASIRKDVENARRGVLNLSDAGTQTKESAKILVASIARDIADQLVRHAGRESLDAIENQINESYVPESFAIENATATVSVDLKPAVLKSDNVIGQIAGKGPLSSQTIVIGGHYDHVGMGGYASLAPGTIAVHNGADDNASGTAAMLACARLLREKLSGVSNHRTMVFIAFTGEERGLVGSQYYVEHPAYPIEQTTTMINFDMVGRLRDNELTVYGTGTASDLEGLVDEANESMGFDLYKVASGYGPSDHQSFYRAGVPVLFFFTGLHNDYHRPSDDFDKIDFGSLGRITDMVSNVAYRLAVMPRRPVYADTDPRIQIRRQMTAYLGIRVSLLAGSVEIVEVTSGGPASQAGLQVGDRIKSIGRKQIQTTNDLLSWVRNHSAGDEFEIKIERQGSEMTRRGKLEKRPE